MDVKPSNILVNIDHSSGKVKDVKLADFGISLSASGTQAMHERGGSTGYMAPEVLQEKARLDRKVDSYSLGVLLYNLVSGQMPPSNSQISSRRYQEEGWQNCSPHAIDLTQALL